MFRPSAKLAFAIACLVFIPAAAHAAECTVTFGFQRDARVSGVVVDVDYAGSGVAIANGGESVRCEAGSPGVLATFNDRDEQGLLSAALIRVEPFGGSNVFSCTVSGADVDAGDFTVRTVDATDSSAHVVSPLPTTVVTGVACGTARSVPDPETEVCDVTFTLASDTLVSGVVFEASYNSQIADPVGAGDGVECETLLAQGLGSYNDKESTSTLLGALVHVAGVKGSVDVTRCRFAAPTGLDAADLDVQVTDAVDPDGHTPATLPAVFVGDITCGTSGSSTGGDDGGTTTGSEPQSCNGSYDVTFAVTGNDVLGALQFAVGYASAGGTFAGSADGVDCSGLVGGISMGNDQDDAHNLIVGIMSVQGFEAPLDVMTCRFEALGGVPTADDFDVTVQAVSDPEGHPVSIKPAVYVSSIAAADGSGCSVAATCGNGIVESGEECDDGNTSDTDGCAHDCIQARCGDGFVHEGMEQCDDGEANGDGASCESDCTRPNSCGDIDRNGAVTANDAAQALGDAVGLSSKCSRSLCDVNKSGIVTVSDARMILSAAVGQSVDLDCSLALVVSLDDDVAVGGLELTLDYSQSGAVIYGDGDDAACVSLVDGAVVAFNNDAAAGRLHVAMVAVPAIEGPASLIACNFYESGAAASLKGFVVEVGDAIAPDFSPLEDPAISVAW